MQLIPVCRLIKIRLGSSLLCIPLFAFFVFLLCLRNCKQLLLSFSHSPSGPFFPPPLEGTHAGDWQSLLQQCLW